MGRSVVIGVDSVHAANLAAAYRLAVGGTDPLLDVFEPTISDPDFPGALFAWPRDTPGVPVFYAAAETPTQWRRLRPLLLAFVGPTLTSFTGGQSRLNASRPHEQVLANAGLATVARLVPTPETAESTLRALRRLVTMVGKTPRDAEPPVESTGRLLARIRDHLNALALEQAWDLFHRCRSEHRLDALNLKFLEIEIHAAARNWRAIANLRGFDDLLRTRRPPAVTAALLESLYWSSFGDETPTPAMYVDTVRPRARDLVRLPPPAGLRDGAWWLYGLEALASGPQSAGLASAALASGADLGAIAEALAAVAQNSVSSVAPAVSAGEAAAAAIVTADLAGGLSAIDHARALLAQLTTEERAELLQSEQPRRALASIAETFGTGSTPLGWTDWLAALDNNAFTAALAIARQGAQEWDPTLGDPVEIAGLAASLNAVPDEPPASDRLVEGLPHFVAWLQRDPDFPRLGGFAVYEAALERLMLSGRAGAPMLDSAAVLARAILAVGPTASAYRRLLSDLLAFSGDAAGVRTAYWLIELLEETAAAPSPDQPAREQFWQDGLARLIPIAPQLSRLQRASIVMLATSLGWNAALPEEIAAHPDGNAEPDTRLAERLGGKTVAIYTLTESAALQAAETLKTLAPDVDVRISSEHGGSRSLRALAENADLFVVVTASATHAATDFIRMKRRDLPLTYAAGRGAVSILRAVEAWASSN